LTFERALEGIEAQLRSDEVNMVMDCLRNAKRFHATVSFIADTGLKDATDQGKLFQYSNNIQVAHIPISV
jgi:dynein heavy chain 1